MAEVRVMKSPTGHQFPDHYLEDYEYLRGLNTTVYGGMTSEHDVRTQWMIDHDAKIDVSHETIFTVKDVTGATQSSKMASCDSAYKKCLSFSNTQANVHVYGNKE